MATNFPFRSAIGPGSTTVTGDPNNPFGGDITQQSMIPENEDSLQTIMRLTREGLSVDQIAQMTGIPQEEVAMQVAVMNQDRSAFMPGGDLGEAPFAGQGKQGIGIESLMTDTDTPEISAFIDEGNSFTDLASSGLDISLDPSSYLDEAQIVQNLETFGVDLDDADADLLDQEDDPTKKAITASAVGATANGESDPDASKTLETMTAMNNQFDLDDPDDSKAMLNIYKKAAEDFYNVDDLKALVPQPDKALPFMIAGAALIQAGEKGDSWGTALSNAFLQYAMAGKKEEKEYEKQILALDIKEKEDIKRFATELYMTDIKEQMALQRALLTKESKPYKVGNNPNPVYLRPNEARARAEKGEVITEWRAEDGTIKEYTIFEDVNRDGQPDVNAPARTELLTSVGAQNKQSEGFIIREGNLTKGKKLYMVDDVFTMYSTEELEAFMEANPGSNVKVVGASSVKAVIDRATGQPTFVDQRTLLTERGREMYAPIGEESMAVFGPDGNPLLLKGDVGGMGGFLTESQRGKEQARVTQFLREVDQKRDNVLTTHYTIKKLLADQKDAGKDIVFGAAGGLTTFGKNVIDQVDQLGKVFTQKDSGYAFYNDANGNGKKDPGEESLAFGDLGKQFEDQIANTNLGRFLQGSGLGKKRLTNMVLTLALQSAANDDQKGRDISDKDIERFLTRAGAYATSEAEFVTMIDDLALGAIRKHESLVDSEMRYSPRFKVDDSDEMKSMIDILYPNLIEEQYAKTPFVDAPYTIRELKDQLLESTTGIRSGDYKGNVQQVGQESAVLPGGDELSGVGQSTIHGIYEQYKMAEDGMAYLAALRKSFDKEGQPGSGKDSPEYKAIKEYIQRQLGQQ